MLSWWMRRSLLMWCISYRPTSRRLLIDIFHMIRDIVRHQHIYKVEMIQSMVNVLKLLVSELPYENVSVDSRFAP